jgi:hypothetical protein
MAIMLGEVEQSRKFEGSILSPALCVLLAHNQSPNPSGIVNCTFDEVYSCSDVLLKNWLIVEHQPPCKKRPV